MPSKNIMSRIVFHHGCLAWMSWWVQSQNMLPAICSSHGSPTHSQHGQTLCWWCQQQLPWSYRFGSGLANKTLGSSAFNYLFIGGKVNAVNSHVVFLARQMVMNSLNNDGIQVQSPVWGQRQAVELNIWNEQNWDKLEKNWSTVKKEYQKIRYMICKSERQVYCSCKKMDSMSSKCWGQHCKAISSPTK